MENALDEAPFEVHGGTTTVPGASRLASLVHLTLQFGIPAVDILSGARRTINLRIVDGDWDDAGPTVRTG